MKKKEYSIIQEHSSNKDSFSCTTLEFNNKLQPIPSLAVLVKEGREHHMLSKSELATLAGLNPTEITRIESEQTLKPSKKVLAALAPYIGIPFNKLSLYAGYSDIVTEEIYFGKKGNKIPYYDILDAIYKADSELLELLIYADKMELPEINALKNIIILSQKELLTFDDSEPSLITKMKQYIINMKKVIFSQLQNAVEILLCSGHT